MCPVPGKVVTLRVMFLDVVNRYTVDSRQITEDEVEELRLGGAVMVDERSKSLGVFSPTVACDEHFRLLFWFCVLRIGGVHTIFPYQRSLRNRQ